MNYEKKTSILLVILLMTLSFSYCQDTFKESKYEITENLKKKSSTIYIGVNTKEELLCVKEHYSSYTKAYYSFYLYNKDRKLIKSSLLKTKPINKVFFQNDSIYLIRHKKEGVAFNLNFSILSSSTKDFNFQEQKWFTIKNEKKHWGTNADKFETSFFESSFSNKLLHLSNLSYSPNKTEVNEADLKILASDSKKRKKFYSSSFYIDFLDKNLNKELSKKVIITNNLGPFSVEKQLIDYDNKTLYLLLSTFDKKLDKLIKFTSLKKPINTKYHLVKITKDSIKHITINNPPHEIATANIELFKNDIICVGMYSDTNSSKIHGCFKLKFNTLNLIQTDAYYSGFTDSFLNDKEIGLNNFNKKRKNYRKFEDLSYEYISIDASGNCTLNIEEYYIPKNTTSLANFSTVEGVGIPLDGGFTADLSISTNGLKVQKGIITAKITNDNKLLWSRYIKNIDREDIYFLSKNINGIDYIIKNDTPLTYK